MVFHISNSSRIGFIILRLNVMRFRRTIQCLWTVGTTISHGALNVTLEQRNSDLDNGQGGISRKPVLYASALYSLRQFNSLPFNMNSFLLGATTTYDQSSRQISEVTCDISANILKQGRFRIGYRNDLLLKISTGFLELTFDFDFTRSSTSLYTGGRNAFSQSVSGALVYASDENTLSVYGRQWNDNTGANFRMFLDENGNDKHDEGEKIIEGASVSIGQSGNCCRMHAIKQNCAMSQCQIIFGFRSIDCLHLSPIHTERKPWIFRLWPSV